MDVKISEFPTNFIPAGCIELTVEDKETGLVLKGFYDPDTKETHIQEEEHGR